MEELARRDAKCQSCIIPFTSCQSAPRLSAGLEREVKLNRAVQVMEGAGESVEYNSLQTLLIIIAHRRSTELPDRLNSSLPTELLCCVFLTCYIWGEIAKLLLLLEFFIIYYNLIELELV